MTSPRRSKRNTGPRLVSSVAKFLWRSRPFREAVGNASTPLEDLIKTNAITAVGVMADLYDKNNLEPEHMFGVRDAAIKNSCGLVGVICDHSRDEATFLAVGPLPGGTRPQQTRCVPPGCTMHHAGCQGLDTMAGEQAMQATWRS